MKNLLGVGAGVGVGMFKVLGVVVGVGVGTLKMFGVGVGVGVDDKVNRLHSPDCNNKFFWFLLV